MTAPGNIVFTEVEIPLPGDDEALLKMMKIGICGSDIHVYHGKHPYTRYPVTQGHEVSGQVVAVGKLVKHLTAGQKVTIQPQVVCGACYPCRHGKYNLCEALKVMGFQTTGAASRYFAVDAAKVTVLPDSMTFDEGAMIEPLAVGVHAARQAGDVTGMKAAVIGAGPIGILTAQALKGMGAAGVLVTDVLESRLDRALECGADYAVNTAVKPFGDTLIDCFGSDGADVIYDCAGNDITIGQAIRYARKGSAIILVAVFDGPAHIDLAALNDRELCLNTSMMYRNEDYMDAIRLVSEGKVALRPLMSGVFPFGDYQRAYEYIESNRDAVMKILIDVQA
jgi:L-iditol 2-dehydrogenase